MNKIELFSIIIFISFITFSFLIARDSTERDTELLTASIGTSFALSRIFSSFDVFGGRISKVVNCTCVGTWKLFTVGPPSPGTFMVNPGSTPPLYKFRRVTSGVWTVGIASGNKICLVIVKSKCVSAGSGPVVKLMGTSE